MEKRRMNGYKDVFSILYFSRKSAILKENGTLFFKNAKEGNVKVMRKKLFSFLICLCMAATLFPAAAFAADSDQTKGYEGQDLPRGPDTTGDVWVVTPETAQYTLDGAYGSIDGKTICFGAGDYTEELVLARPTKYEGSNTQYYNMNWTAETGWVKDEEPVSLEGIESHITTYNRTIENVTFTAAKGVELPGISASSGHVYTAGSYDYVRDQRVDGSENSYYANCSLKNISFEGLAIRGQVKIMDYSKEAENAGIRFEDCDFQGSEQSMTENTYAAVKMGADNKYFEDVEVSGCSFQDYFQGVYIQGVKGAQIRNCTFDHTTHNAIALQSSTANDVQGEIVIEENIIKNAADRAIRLGDAEHISSLQIHNNVMVGSGDESGELFKAQSLPEETAAISLEDNYWNGANGDTAVSNEAVRPVRTGIAGGTFSEDVSEYVSEDFKVSIDGDGNFVVSEAEDVAEIAGVRYKSLEKAVAAAGEGDTITLLADVKGNGVVVEGGKHITIDFAGHTYDIDGATVGSPGTETNGFQLLKGSDIIMKNGTITSSKALILIQNYSNLTLLDMNLDGSRMPVGHNYTLSNNCGDVKILGKTSITAAQGNVAFDLYYWPPSYKEGVKVTVDTTGTITGPVEYTTAGTEADTAKNTALVIRNVNLKGELDVQAEGAQVTVSGGRFDHEIPAEYCAEGFEPVANPDGTYGVCDHAAVELKNVKEATCTEKGYTGDTYCKTCGKLLKTGEELPLTAHDYQWVVDKQASAGESGLRHQECKVCGHKGASETIPATGEAAPDGKPGDSVPATGENTNMTLWIVLLAVAGVGIITAAIVYWRTSAKRK